MYNLSFRNVQTDPSFRPLRSSSFIPDVHRNLGLVTPFTGYEADFEPPREFSDGRWLVGCGPVALCNVHW